MKRVVCAIEGTTLTNDSGQDVAATKATCEQCDHVTVS